MSSPTQVWGPEGLAAARAGSREGGVERISPERPEPQPMSRSRDGEVRERRERARRVISRWIRVIREEVVYFRDVEVE